MRNCLLKFFMLTTVLFTLVSCEDPPDCYYNALFGCGPFDIPWSSQYYGNTRKAVLQTTIPFRKPKDALAVNGVWQATLQKKSSTCAFPLPPQFSGEIAVKQVGTSVTVSSANGAIPKSKKGTVTKNGFTATGSGIYSLCTYSYKMTAQTVGKKSVGVSAAVRCLMTPACTVDYKSSTFKKV